MSIRGIYLSLAPASQSIDPLEALAAAESIQTALGLVFVQLTQSQDPQELALALRAGATIVLSQECDALLLLVVEWLSES